MNLFRNSILVFSILLFASHWSLAMDNPEAKLTAVIKDFILTKYPNWSKDEISLTFKQPEKFFEELKGLDEGAQFSLLEVYPDFKPAGNVIFPVLITSGEKAQKILLRTKVAVKKNIAAAARLIRKNKVLESADVKFEERDVALLPEKYFTENSMTGKEAKISIPAGSTIFDWMVGERPLIRRGAEVTLIVSAPGLTVRARGQALVDGYADSEIKIKRSDSKKTITARVLSASEVEVKL